jgi:hypothetical protein
MLAMLQDKYRGVAQSSTYRSATTKCAGRVIRHNLKLPTVLLFVALDTTLALAIMTKRDFVGAGQSRGCETAQVDQH